MNMTYHSISSRERQILTLTSFEKTSKEIAAKLYISPHTVITHRKNLMHKLEVKNVAGLIRKGFEIGILKV